MIQVQLNTIYFLLLNDCTTLEMHHDEATICKSENTA